MIHDARAAYLDASVSTASPARLLVMLCERLVLDVQRGADALAGGDRSTAHTNLVHAQEIVLELRSSLKVDGFDGGPQLASLYDFLHSSLVKANMNQDAAIARSCLSLVTDLAATWREAAVASLNQAG